MEGTEQGRVAGNTAPYPSDALEHGNAAGGGQKVSSAKQRVAGASRKSIAARLNPSTHFLDFSMQTRKPYTMTRQREKWTDEEHQRFVEALRIHGRQWRKIEGEPFTSSS